MKGCTLAANIEGQGWKANTVYQFLRSNLWVEIFLKKRKHQKKGALKYIED